MKVRDQLKKLGIKPVGGQHFLESETIIRALVESGEVEGKNVIEIGSGTGAITEKLLEKAGSVTAVEKDTKLANYVDQEYSGVNVINKDFLELDDLDFERCVSNVPFEISSDVVRKLGRHQIQSSLVLQDQVADKIVAEPGESNYNKFSVICQYFYVPVKLRKVPSTTFYPAPNVEAAIVKLYPNRDRHGVEKQEKFLEVVNALFTHKRKKVRNAFVDARHILEYEKQDAKKIRDDLPNSEKRVNQLEVRELAEIAENV